MGTSVRSATGTARPSGLATTLPPATSTVVPAGLPGTGIGEPASGYTWVWVDGTDPLEFCAPHSPEYVRSLLDAYGPLWATVEGDLTPDGRWAPDVALWYADDSWKAQAPLSPLADAGTFATATVAMAFYDAERIGFKAQMAEAIAERHAPVRPDLVPDLLPDLDLARLARLRRATGAVVRKAADSLSGVLSHRHGRTPSGPPVSPGDGQVAPQSWASR